MANIICWYKPDTITGNVGDRQISWPDSGPNGYTLSTVDYDNSPTIISDNGTKALHFTTASNYTYYPTPQIHYPPYTIHFVYKMNSRSIPGTTIEGLLGFNLYHPFYVFYSYGGNYRVYYQHGINRGITCAVTKLKPTLEYKILDAQDVSIECSNTYDPTQHPKGIFSLRQSVNPNVSSGSYNGNLMSTSEFVNDVEIDLIRIGWVQLKYPIIAHMSDANVYELIVYEGTQTETEFNQTISDLLTKYNFLL